MAEAQLIRCHSCNASNRVPPERIAQGLQPVCGRCKALLPVENKPMTVTDATFAAEIEQSPLPVLLDMWAPWCGPCRMIAPIVESLAAEMGGRLRVAKMNVDDNPMASARFQIQSIPALLLLKGGKEIDRMVGVRGKADIVRWIEKAIA